MASSHRVFFPGTSLSLQWRWEIVGGTSLKRPLPHSGKLLVYSTVVSFHQFLQVQEWMDKMRNPIDIMQKMEADNWYKFNFMNEANEPCH